MSYFIFFICVLLISLIFFIGKSIKDEKTRAKIGLRSPHNHDGYEDKGVALFRKECQEHSIATDPINMPNLCYLIPVLNLKGLHIELIKEDNQSYILENGKYIGSDLWQEKWRRIVFSSTITSKEFCRCILIIMHAHKFYESDNNVLPYVRGLDGLIKEKDSFFIYRALYIMRYNIKIRKNDESLSDIKISNSLSLKKRADFNYQFINPEKELHTKQLKEIVKFHEGQNIDESKITLDKNDYGLIFTIDIENGTSSMFYRTSNLVKHIRQGYLIYNTDTPFNINRWKQDDAVLTSGLIALEIIDEDILGDFLLFYLKRVLKKISSNKCIKNLSIDKLKRISVLIPPRSLQVNILKNHEKIDENLLKTQILQELEESIDQNAEYLLKQFIEDNGEDTDKNHYGDSSDSNSIQAIEINGGDTDKNHYGDSSESNRIQPIEINGEECSYISHGKWVKGYYKKNGTYVRGHYRY